MPRRAAGLSAAKVKTAAPGRYGDGLGLYLLVKAPTPKHMAAGEKDGGRYWLARYTLGGRMREMGLGAATGPGAVTLAEVRDKAKDLHRLVKAGVDPLAQRDAAAAAARAEAQQAAIAAITFRDVASLYIAAHEAAWKNSKHRQQWQNTLDAYAFPHLGDVPVAEVETAHVMAVLEPLWHAKTETASRLRGRLEAVLDYARARGWRAGANPAAWRGHLVELLPARAKIAPTEHHAALPWQHIGDFMAALRGQAGVGARALEFAILTAARTGEVLGATWAEVDMQASVWTVPAARMKAGREHRVPLAPAALAVLREVAALRITDAPEGFVFPGGREGKPLSDMALTMTLRRMQRGDLTAHGFRSTFRDWTAERTGFQREVAEAALAHMLGDKVEAAYRRGDLFEKRARLMSEWAAFCGRRGANGRVVAMRA
jgi:integrase